VSTLLLNLFLALAWLALTGNFTPINFISGFLLGYLVLWVIRRSGESREYFAKVPQTIGFVAFFIKELVIANIRVAYDVLTPRHRMRPGVIAVPLDVTTDTEITLLGSLITLTPGTLTLDVSPDKKVMYVHAMYIDDIDKVRLSIKQGFERRVIEMLR
jgi:multicomponent Na+:H+ antiporter subunit E